MIGSLLKPKLKTLILFQPEKDVVIQTKCTYTYIYENKNYTNNIISPVYWKGNNENIQEYEILKYTNIVTAYINPDKPKESILAKGISASTTSLLIFSISWSGILIMLWKQSKHTPFVIILFICVMITLASEVLHSNFKIKINTIDKKIKRK